MVSVCDHFLSECGWLALDDPLSSPKQHLLYRYVVLTHDDASAGLLLLPVMTAAGPLRRWPSVIKRESIESPITWTHLWSGEASTVSLYAGINDDK